MSFLVAHRALGAPHLREGVALFAVERDVEPFDFVVSAARRPMVASMTLRMTNVSDHRVDAATRHRPVLAHPVGATLPKSAPSLPASLKAFCAKTPVSSAPVRPPDAVHAEGVERVVVAETRP